MQNIKMFEDFHGMEQEATKDFELTHYMFFQNLNTMKHAIEEIMQMDHKMIDNLLSDDHGWAVDHISTSADDVEEVYHFLKYRSGMGVDTKEPQQGMLVNIQGSNDKVEIEEDGEDE
jgi:hypothetical protein